MLFHGALFELALFEIPQDDGSVVEVFLSDTISLSLSDNFAPVVPRIGMSDTINISLSEAFHDSEATLALFDAIALATSEALVSYWSPVLSDQILIGINDQIHVDGEAALEDVLSLLLNDNSESVVAVLAFSDTISLGVADDMAGGVAYVSLEDYITLAISELSQFTKYMPPRSAIGRVGSGGVSGKLKGVRPLGSVGSGRTRGSVG